MLFVIYLLGALNSAIIAFLAYSSSNTILTTVITFVLSGFNALFWSSIVRSSYNSEAAMLNSLYWDIMRMAIYFIVPLMFFEPNLTKTKLLGIFMVGIGLLFTKL